MGGVFKVPEETDACHADFVQGLKCPSLEGDKLNIRIENDMKFVEAHNEALIQIFGNRAPPALIRQLFCIRFPVNISIPIVRLAKAPIEPVVVGFTKDEKMVTALG